MYNVSTILNRKKLTPITIASDEPVIKALQIMAEKNIGSVVVLEGGAYAGIITERDYSRKVILNKRDSSSTRVSEIMTTDLPALTPEDSLDHCMELMSSKNIRYLPVFEKNKLSGIISMSDVVKETILRQKETINQLENYIRS